MEIEKTEEIIKKTGSDSGFKLTTPVAILIGFVLIAGAIFFAPNRNSSENTSDQLEIKGVTSEILEAHDDENIFGNKNAEIAVITYSDSDCPHCATMHGYMDEILADENTDVVWFYRHFPLKPNAVNEAVALECAAIHGGEGAMWDYLSKIIDVTMDPQDPATGEFLLSVAKSIGIDENNFKECFGDSSVQEKIDKQHEEAVVSGGQGTPFNIIVNQKTKQYEVIAGVPRTLDGLVNIIDALR